MPFRRRMSRAKTLRARQMRKTPTPAEALLWSLLRRKQTGFLWRRQSPMLGYIADFYCPALKLVIEVDGPIHDRRVAYDNHRDAVMRAHGLSVVRLRNEHVLEHSAEIIEALRQRG